MKGIMVPLLMLVMTGIVVGQQTDSKAFRSTAYRQTPQASTQGSGSFSPAMNPSDIKPFDLSVSDEQVKGILNGGELVSKIEPRDQATGQLLSLNVINAVTLIHKKNANRQLTVRKLRGKDAGQGKLEFELDDRALLDLETNKLSFDIPELDRGRFNQVAFYYKAPSPGVNSTPAIGSGLAATGPGSNAGPSRFTFGLPQEDSGGFLPLPGPEAVPGDEDFVGPVFVPSNDQQIAENNRPAGWNANPGNSRNLGATNQGFGGNQPSGWTVPPGNPQQETLAEFQNRVLLEKWKQDQIDAKLRQQEQAGNQVANGGQGNQMGNPGWPAAAQPNLPGLTDQQLADRLAFLKRQNEIKAYEAGLAAREAELAKQKKELEYQRFVDSLKVNPSNDILPQFTPQTGPVAGINYQPSGPVLERPDRFASTNMNNTPGGGVIPNTQTPTPRLASNNNSPVPTGGVGNFVASIPSGASPESIDSKVQEGIDAENKQTRDKRSERFIYFMLLCSLGLNTYLGWISRGFYVRYNELADELRETFTATM